MTRDDPPDEFGHEPVYPKPWYLQGPALIGWGAVVGLLIAALAWGIIQLTNRDAGDSTPVAPSSEAPPMSPYTTPPTIVPLTSEPEPTGAPPTRRRTTTSRSEDEEATTTTTTTTTGEEPEDTAEEGEPHLPGG